MHYLFIIRLFISLLFNFYSLTIYVLLIPEFSRPFTVRTEIFPSGDMAWHFSEFLCFSLVGLELEYFEKIALVSKIKLINFFEVRRRTQKKFKFYFHK